MSNSPTAEELKRRYSQWSTEDLIEAVTLNADQYIPSAIEVMRSLLQSRGVPESEMASVKSNLARDRSDEKIALSRVRGWLVVFIVVVALNSLVQLVMAANLGLAPLSLGTSLMTLILGAAGLYGGYAALLLIKKHPRAPVHAQRWLMLTLAITVVSAVLVYVALGEAPTRALSAAIFVALWLSYLHQSKRVAHVYGVGITD